MFLEKYKPELKEKIFKAFHFGPYSSKIDDSLYFLITNKIISHEEILNQKISDKNIVRDFEDLEVVANFSNKYFLNSDQKEKALKMLQKINKDFPEDIFDFFINDFKVFIKELNEKTIMNILDDVYTEFPEYALNSIIKKEK